MTLWKLETVYVSGFNTHPIYSYTTITIKDLKTTIRETRSKGTTTKIEAAIPIDKWLIEAAFKKIFRTSGGRHKNIIRIKILPGGSDVKSSTKQ